MNNTVITCTPNDIASTCYVDTTASASIAVGASTYTGDSVATSVSAEANRSDEYLSQHLISFR